MRNLFKIPVVNAHAYIAYVAITSNNPSYDAHCPPLRHLIEVYNKSFILLLIKESLKD